MKWMSRSKLIGVLGGTLGLLFLVPGASAGSHKDHPYRYSILGMPVSLAVGTVRTPEFSVGGNWYWIMIQVEKPLPFMQMECMMGVLPGGPLYSKIAVAMIRCFAQTGPFGMRAISSLADRAQLRLMLNI